MQNLTGLKKGDVIENGDERRKVLEVVGCLYFLSAKDSSASAGFPNPLTLADLDYKGYRIVETAREEWRPKVGETYHAPDIYSSTLSFETLFENDDADLKRLSLGIVCRTKEEAIALAEKMLKAV